MTSRQLHIFEDPGMQIEIVHALGRDVLVIVTDPMGVELICALTKYPTRVVIERKWIDPSAPPPHVVREPFEPGTRVLLVG